MFERDLLRTSNYKVTTLVVDEPIRVEMEGYEVVEKRLRRAVTAAGFMCRNTGLKRK